MSEIISIHQRFLKFHAENPEVYILFASFAFEAISQNKKVGQRMIWERMRWEIMIKTKDAPVSSVNDMKFKLNDHYTKYYAQLFMEKNPQHAGYFEVRERKKI